jgi:hypothetical protein
VDAYLTSQRESEVFDHSCPFPPLARRRHPIYPSDLTYSRLPPQLFVEGEARRTKGKEGRSVGEREDEEEKFKRKTQEMRTLD